MKTQSLNRLNHCDISKILIITWNKRVVDFPRYQYAKIVAKIKITFVVTIYLFFVTEIVKKDNPIERNE